MKLFGHFLPYYDAEKEQGTDEQVEEKVEEQQEEEVEEKQEEVEEKKEEEVEEEKKEEEPKKPDWRDRELGRKHAKLQEATKRAAELEAENAAMKRLLEKGGKVEEEKKEEKKTFTEEDVKAEAKKQREVEKYNDDCNKAAAEGQKAYGKEWDTAMNNLRQLGGLELDTMQQVLSTDNPAQVLHALGSDPEKFHEVMDLPPARRFAALVKLGMPKEKETKGVSKASPPVNGVRSKAPADTGLRDDLDDAEWQRRRHAQRAKRFEARSGSKAPSYN